MKRFLLAMLLVSFLLCLQGRAPSFAQAPAQQQPPAPAWQTLSDRAWKTDLGGEQPEVLILKMSNEEFEKFHANKKAAMDYIDDHHFLKKKLNKVIFCDVLWNKHGESVGWDVIIIHNIQSWVTVVASQIPKS